MEPGASPISGRVPPPEHRFKPGQSGNPQGRTTAGATVREHINQFAEAGLKETELRKIGRDKDATWAKRTAAERMLRTMEAGDLSDFDDFINGEKSLVDLRAAGINTEVVKKIKQRSRKVPAGEGETEEIIEREVELHDRAGVDFDRIIDHTAGKPVQAVEMSGPNKGPIEIKKDVDYDAIEAELKQIGMAGGTPPNSPS